MNLRYAIVVIVVLLSGCSVSFSQPEQVNKHTRLSTHDIIKNAPQSQWQRVRSDDIVKITLPTGAAYIQLNPLLAPQHVQQIKALAREGFYEGTNMYRVVEGFVAQGGDATGIKNIKTANKTIPAEFYLTSTSPLKITEIGGDGYAPQTGFLNSFAIAQNKQGTQTWQVHCNGVFAMARDNNINSASTQFYVTIGQGPRYLDKNITVFGRVLEGMQHFNRLQRDVVNNQTVNPIEKVQILSDIPSDNSVFRVLKTDSSAFKALIQARKNRYEEWFVYQHNYIDVCAVPIPTQRVQ
ncbi:peptidylprolyl isomerase [Pseudoalteromonas sp. MMG010]|uniref:peptidylprolyl isomerase n=1 Tax=Pseudoalteromonas sp. MMG010 TaxID=2822685 RepID=UPI001B3A268B|nr:peptidylprolyl isomerase [Pseudoalteromonas sp. MMG010]MBQ4831659.1 peptidylprolyl isomerase [Pseudoalteromonas sp. MMG010]